jgi:hypothetical protein
MRTTILALCGAAGVALLYCQSVSVAPAGPAGAAAIKDSAARADIVQQAQYYERRTRRGLVKCYREAVIGPYVCHRYGYW